MSRTPVTDWQQLSALYEQADALDPVPLAAWMTELRRQQHALLPQLEQMLDARLQIRSNGFLGSLPHLATTPESRPTEWQAKARIGPYRLLRRIGSGGMAEVWLADRDDGAFQRQVAIKLLFRHAASRDGDAFARRFERERDILASLNHPNIARLHDAGVTQGGQPWLALEYVEGEIVTAWCDAHRLTLAARVGLFRQILLAVQHAHANLVIHRDLKPGNILVTGQGEVRLLDFGIAKLMEAEGDALGDTELTRLAGRPMTPQYASPEQLAGRALTTGSDVYSLGVVLYELLCGERPYELKVDSAAQLERSILDIDPRAPSRRAILDAAAAARGATGAELRRQLANDLDAIVLRALAKKPAQRYGSVEAFGADLERWAEGKPVEARAPGKLYRAGKFMRRHTLAVSLSAGAVLALMVVTVVAVLTGLQAKEDSSRAMASRDFMLNIFRLADKEKSHGADITARELLETGRKDVSTRLAGQPKLQAELLAGIAKIQGDMGEYGAADSTFAELARTFASLNQTREEVLAELDRAWNAMCMNRPDLAASLMQDAKVHAGPTLNDPEVQAGLAQVAGTLALVEGHAEQAHGSLIVAREAAIRALGIHSLRTFWLGQALVRADRDTGRVDDALALQEELRATAKKIGGLGPDFFANMDLDQANILYGAGKFQGAFKFTDLALPRCVDALGDRSQLCRYLEVERAQVLQRLGWADLAMQAVPRIRANQEDPNLPYLQIQSLALELRLRSSTPFQAQASELQRAFERVKDFADSEQMQPTLRAGAMLYLAESRLRLGDWQQARRWIEGARALLHDGGDQPANSRTGANAQMLMGIALLEQGQAEEAMPWLRRALDYVSSSAGVNHPNAQWIALNLALAEEAMGRTNAAWDLARSAERPLLAALGPDAPSYQVILQMLKRLHAQASERQDLFSTAPVHAEPMDVARSFFSI